MSIGKDKRRKTYYFEVRYKDAFGKPQRYRSKDFPTKDIARDEERYFLNRLDEGKPNLMTYEYAYKHYLKHTELSPKTLRRKEGEHRLHILPFFKDIKLSEMTSEQVNEFRTYCIEHFDSINSARAIFTTFRTVINYSIKYLNNRNNPVLSVRPIGRVKKLKTTISREEIEGKVIEFKNIDYKEISLLLFFSGLRIGECLGIMWKYVYFEDDEILLAGKVDIDTNEYHDYLKTENSQTYIVVPQHIMDMLRKRYEREKVKYKYFDGNYFVFGGMSNIWYNNYNVAFKQVFPNLTPHALRHSYAKHLLDKGIPMYDLKELLRHDDIKTTINTYGNFDRKGKHKSMKYFD